MTCVNASKSGKLQCVNLFLQIPPRCFYRCTVHPAIILLSYICLYRVSTLSKLVSSSLGSSLALLVMNQNIYSTHTTHLRTFHSRRQKNKIITLTFPLSLCFPYYLHHQCPPLSITLCMNYSSCGFQPWHVSSGLFCGRDLIKIIRNEPIDQHLLTTCHRPVLDKPWPCPSASFQQFSCYLSICIHMLAS